jgi:hypothetical protein
MAPSSEKFFRTGLDRHIAGKPDGQISEGMRLAQDLFEHARYPGGARFSIRTMATTRRGKIGSALGTTIQIDIHRFP